MFPKVLYSFVSILFSGLPCSNWVAWVLSQQCQPYQTSQFVLRDHGVLGLPMPGMCYSSLSSVNNKYLLNDIREDLIAKIQNYNIFRLRAISALGILPALCAGEGRQVPWTFSPAYNIVFQVSSSLLVSCTKLSSDFVQ